MSATANKVKSSAPRLYEPHATRRMESLAGMPLASFKARAAAFLFDMVLILILYIPVMWLLKWLVAGRKVGAHIDISWDFHELSNVIFTLLYFGLSLFGAMEEP
ncbi:MAG TPA: hypothetical protein VJW96_08230 [Terriglobales bacterium]|nr:hypothetical protein [Terriglobales bacterium]